MRSEPTPRPAQGKLSPLPDVEGIHDDAPPPNGDMLPAGFVGWSDGAGFAALIGLAEAMGFMPFIGLNDRPGFHETIGLKPPVAGARPVP